MLAHTTATNKTALERAAGQGVIVKNEGGNWYASSVSHRGQWHRVNDSCDCDAGRRGMHCKHVAAVEAARTGQWHQCSHCGYYSADVRMASAYVGGQGYVNHYICTNRQSCWHRWDIDHGLAS